MRVVVVGAGLAGLTAATNLTRSGHSVTLIEAGSRLGGRARTVRAPFADGQYIESGAEWIDSHHHRIVELLERHEMMLLGEGERWTTIRRWLHHRGRLMSPADVGDEVRSQLEAFDKIVDHAATSIADPACPQSSSRAAELDALSLADVADDVGLGELARLFRRRDSQGEFAEEPGGVSLLFVAQQRAISVASSAGEDVRSHRLAGGLDCLVARVAAGIADTIATDEPLLSVEHSDHQVTVTTSKRRIDADAMVLACSLIPLRAVRFDPPLPSLLADAVHRLGYGTVTKTAVQFAERQWQAGYATTEGISQRIYEPTVDQSGVAGALMSYAGGDGGRRLADHSEVDRITMVEADMRAVHGVTAPTIAGFSRAWSSEPRFGGSYAVYRPGQVTAFWDVLRRPHGRLWLAGEHTATWTGYLEGAVESGERVAAEIHAAG